MKKEKSITRYKVLRPDWTCNPTGNNPKQYSCPGTFEEDVTPSVGNRGMHFCKELSDCFRYCLFNPDDKDTIKAIPNFDEAIFEKCTGIKVRSRTNIFKSIRKKFLRL